MKIQLILLLSLSYILSNDLLSQSSKVIFSIESSIGLADRIFQNDGSIPNEVIDLYSDLEKNKISYDFALIGGYKLSKRIMIESGLRLVSWGYRSNKRDLLFSVGDPDYPTSIRNSSSNYYLEFPIRINYQIEVNKNIFLLRGGVFPSLNMSNKYVNKLYFENRSERNVIDNSMTTKFRQLNLICELGIMWNRSLYNNHMISIGPTLRVQSKGIVHDVSLNRKLYFYGLSLGISL